MGSMGSNILWSNVHTGSGQAEGPGPIVSVLFPAPAPFKGLQRGMKNNTIHSYQPL